MLIFLKPTKCTKEQTDGMTNKQTLLAIANLTDSETSQAITEETIKPLCNTPGIYFIR